VTVTDLATDLSIADLLLVEPLQRVVSTATGQATDLANAGNHAEYATAETTRHAIALLDAIIDATEMTTMAAAAGATIQAAMEVAAADKATEELIAGTTEDKEDETVGVRDVAGHLTLKIVP
jgi:hypothetical protein